jgi:hypothetical protein
MEHHARRDPYPCSSGTAVSLDDPPQARAEGGHPLGRFVAGAVPGLAGGLHVGRGFGLCRLHQPLATELGQLELEDVLQVFVGVVVTPPIGLHVVEGRHAR